MPLYLTEADVTALLTPLAAGVVENAPRRRLALEGGRLADMAAVDLELGYAGAKIYAGFSDGAAFVVALFDAARPELVAVIEADQLGRLRTGAASAVASKYLAREGASSLGVIGCGRQAETQVACIRAAVPTIERVVAYCRTDASLKRFCRAVGANALGARELDNVVIQRAGFVCCDSKEQARLESSDLVEPIEQGDLDWLEVHELQEVVAGDVSGRQSDDDVVVFKSNGIAAWDVAIAARAVELARERGVGRAI